MVLFKHLIIMNPWGLNLLKKKEQRKSKIAKVAYSYPFEEVKLSETAHKK